MKFKSYVIFFLLFGVLPDIFLCRYSLLVWIPTAFELVSLVMIGTNFRYTPAVRAFSYLTFLFEFPKFIAFLCSLFMGIKASVAAGAMTGIFFAVLIFYVTRNLKVNTLSLSFPDLPDAFSGLRVCQLSDLHLGSFGEGSRYITRIVSSVKELHPDLILFTGDLVNFLSSEADSYLQALAGLDAPMGIISIRGNHDYLLHGPFKAGARERDAARLIELERGLGWTVLLNDHCILEKDGAAIAIAGVENTSGNPFFEKTGGDLGKALEGIPEGTFTILLSHDPSHWKAEVLPCSKVPLTLSGHTHGLKYKLAGLHPSHWKLRESGGLYREGSRTLHVSKGLGSAFAFRLGGFPRIDIITLTNT